MSVIADYLNGNVRITLEDDGTRTMEVPDGEEFEFDYPASMDITITTKCDGGCPYCYMGCTPDGKDAELLDQPVLNTILPGTEVAINLNNLAHRQLFTFLSEMKKRGVIVNGTINQIHFMRYTHILKTLCDSQLLWGLGISLHKPNEEFIRRVKEFPNAVIHVINGLWTKEDIEYMMDKDLKVLILGYKTIGRGVQFKEENDAVITSNQKWLYNNLPWIVSHFHVVSFDNNSLSQLDVKRILSPDDWDTFYQGDEGTLSMFVDLVNGTFSQSSLIDDPVRKYQIGGKSIKEMFEIIKKES